jgi:hypothetical protein
MAARKGCLNLNLKGKETMPKTIKEKQIKSKKSIHEILEGCNPKLIKKKQFPVRLNEYYLTALKLLSNPEEGISMQKIARDFIEKGIEDLLKKRK